MPFLQMNTYWRTLCACLAPISWRVFLPALLMSLLSSLSFILLMAASAWLIASAALHPPLYTLSLGITLVRACGIGRAVFRYFDRCLSHRAVFRALTELRLAACRRAIALLPLRQAGDSQGVLLHDLSENVTVLRDVYLRTALPILLSALLVAVAAAFLFPLSPPMALLVLFTWLLHLLLPFLAKSEGISAKAATDYRNALLEAFHGREELQSPSAREFSLARLGKPTRALSRAQQGKQARERLQDALAQLARALCLVLVFGVLISRAEQQAISGIELAVYLLAVQSVLAELSPLTGAIRGLAPGMAAARRLFSHASLPEQPLPMRREKESVRPGMGHGLLLPVDLSLSPAPPHAVPMLSADRVSFAYGRQPFLLRNLSFRVGEGGKLAIAGESGCGKTTLFYLLLRLWQPDSGTFFLRGQDYGALDPGKIRQSFAAATQGNYVFHGSLRENFRRLHPQITEEEMWAALEIARLRDAAQKLSQGLDTPLGEDAALLSGGQRQRLLVALAAASPAPVLLLDEPTAGLDKSTARDLMHSLSLHCSERTMLIITHDLPLVRQFLRFADENAGCNVDGNRIK